MLILGSGQQVRCFTWIEDVASGIADHSFADATRNQDFNLGNREPVTMIELARMIYRLYLQMSGAGADGELRFTHGETFADDVLVRIPAVDKARTKLGWVAKVKLEEMLRRCLAHELEPDLVHIIHCGVAEGPDGGARRAGRRRARPAAGRPDVIAVKRP